MNYYSNLQELKDYRDNPAISQSYLKQLFTNNSKPYRETLAMLSGSLLDCMLTSPDLTSELYHTGLTKRPSETVRSILTKTLDFVIGSDSVLDEDIEMFKTLILEFAVEVNYQPRWSEDAKWNAILKDGLEYWIELVRSKEKIVVTQQEWDTCEMYSDLTRSSHITGKYFINQPDVDKYFQKPLYWTYHEVQLKGLVDLLIFEWETKKIYLIDIKSSGVSDIKQWFDVCRNKNYPFQMSFYLEGVKHNYNHLLSDGWTIECRWIVIPLDKFKPWVVSVSKEMLDAGRYGVKEYSSKFVVNEKEITNPYNRYGWEHAILLHKYKLENNLLEVDLLYEETGGKLPEQLTNQYYFI